MRRVLRWPFQEGDDLHPPANVAKMRRGKPLNDADRLSWLQAIARWVDQRLAAHQPGIITCSNLKRAYRQITIGSRQGVHLVFLKGDDQVIHAVWSYTSILPLNRLLGAWLPELQHTRQINWCFYIFAWFAASRSGNFSKV